ncbi:MAG: hypothetical protein ABSB11_08620 [Sedimentisphaerales bacterium]|jgi:hypothetical protein
MGLENPQRVSVIDPISPAIEHVRLMLFKPFDLSKWLVIGFCAWLAQLGQGGGGGGGGNGWKEYGHGGPIMETIKSNVIAHLAVIILVAAIIMPIIIIIAVVLCWLRSRGQFMFVHCVAGNKAEVAVPWNKFARHGNSLFLFRIVLGFIGFLVIGIPVAASIFAGFVMCATGFNPAAIIGLTGAIFVTVVVAVLVGLIAKFTTDFVVPIMSLHTESSVAGWKQCLALISGNKAQMLLYILFQIVICLVIAFIVLAICLIGCCCCCASILLLIPYIGTVILLPLIAFKRAYSLFYLRQFGAQFDVFSVQPV